MSRIWWMRLQFPQPPHFTSNPWACYSQIPLYQERTKAQRRCIHQTVQLSTCLCLKSETGGLDTALSTCCERYSSNWSITKKKIPNSYANTPNNKGTINNHLIWKVRYWKEDHFLMHCPVFTRFRVVIISYMESMIQPNIKILSWALIWLSIYVLFIRQHKLVE